MGPSRKELKLRSTQRQAQRTGDRGVIQFALLGMLGADEFYIRDPNHEGMEVFGSQKQKPDISIGADKETHRSETIYFSWPHLIKRITRARATTLLNIVKEIETSAKQVQPLPPTGTNVRYITTI